jgi:hypothetical protein
MQPCDVARLTYQAPCLVTYHQTNPKVAVVVEAFSIISPEKARELGVRKTAGERLHNDPRRKATQLYLAYV